jgi:hypothetical protein
MPTLDGKELLSLKGAGGERFARFVDRLIRAEAHSGILAQSEIDTQVRVNIPDGGVDTRVRAAVPTDRSGFLGGPTCWQYKAETAAELRNRGTVAAPLRFLTEEVTKPEVQRLVLLGHAYRFCFVGDLPPADVDQWEQHLLAECQKINPAAATPRVLDADKLASWADRFPAVAFLVHPFSTDVFNLDSWQDNVRAVTPQYVAYKEWDTVSKAIADHATAIKTTDSCLSVQGEAGVGKTRLVFESLAALKQSASLVMYTRDEQIAVTISQQLAIDPSSPRAIVVADECSLQKRMMIEQNLMGCRERVRFVCLSNTGARGPSGAIEIWLEELPRQIVDTVLKQNFPNVPGERRSAYIDLAGGFIRLSADMCEHDDKLASGDLGPILNKISEYMKFRLPDVEDEQVINSLALFTRIGAKDDVAFELAALCKITGITPQKVTEVSQRIKDSPGFINIAGRFLYVTPAIVARIAFDRGWNLWVRDNPSKFMDKLPSSLLATFLERVRIIATPEVKAAVAATFRSWITTRQSEDLADASQVERLTTLVETDPERYLSLLRQLIIEAPSEVLLSGKAYGSSPRREIVWLCERLVAFTEFYPDCEAILFRLAIDESEPNIGNNASNIWCQIQRIVLSGTSAPFEKRFAKLKQRTRESVGPMFELCLKAVTGMFASEFTRMGSQATIGGRLKPEDWHPKTDEELADCWKKVLGLLQELAHGPDAFKASKAIEATVKHLYSILHAGFVDEAQLILATNERVSSHLPAMIETLEDFLDRTEKSEKAEREAENTLWLQYMAKVQSWLDSIVPTSLEGRLRTVLARNPWHDSVQDSKGQPSENVKQLAAEAMREKAALWSVMPFLMSDDAKVAPLFGAELGRLDPQRELLPSIFGALTPGKNSAFAKGYLFGALREHGNVTPDIKEWLDKVGEVDPMVALELRTTAAEKLDAVKFAIQSVDRQLIPVTVLSRFPYLQTLSIEDLKAILRQFLDAAEAKVDGIDRASVQFLSALHHSEDRKSLGTSSFQDEEVRRLTWRILDTVPQSEGRNDDYQRAEVIEKLAEFESARAATYLLNGMLAKGYGSIHDQMLRALIEMIPRYPNEVMQCFGAAMTDEEKRTTLSIGEAATAIIGALPSAIILNWVRGKGIDAARTIAKELPLPFVQKDGTAIVPEITLGLLNEFGADEETCNGFVRGSFRGGSWWGNGGDFFRAKAASAQRFISHENRCVRRWAQVEVEHAEASAKEEQARFEERML